MPSEYMRSASGCPKVHEMDEFTGRYNLFNRYLERSLPQFAETFARFRLLPAKRSAIMVSDRARKYVG